MGKIGMFVPWELWQQFDSQSVFAWALCLLGRFYWSVSKLLWHRTMILCITSLYSHQLKSSFLPLINVQRAAAGHNWLNAKRNISKNISQKSNWIWWILTRLWNWIENILVFSRTFNQYSNIKEKFTLSIFFFW